MQSETLKAPWCLLMFYFLSSQIPQAFFSKDKLLPVRNSNNSEKAKARLNTSVKFTGGTVKVWAIHSQLETFEKYSTCLHRECGESTAHHTSHQPQSFTATTVDPVHF